MIYKKTITNFITRLSQLVELETTKSDFTKANKLPKKYFEDTYENISNHYKEGMVSKEDMDAINELWEKSLEDKSSIFSQPVENKYLMILLWNKSNLKQTTIEIVLILFVMRTERLSSMNLKF